MRTQVVAACVLAVGAQLSAETICIPGPWTERLRAAKYVVVARVERVEDEVPGIRVGGPRTYILKVARCWKGNKKTLRAHSQGGEDGGGLSVGHYVLAYAVGDPLTFQECDQPSDVAAADTQREIQALDRWRGYPAFTVPTE
jgi:hypothetical protein